MMYDYTAHEYCICKTRDGAKMYVNCHSISIGRSGREIADPDAELILLVRLVNCKRLLI